MRCADVHTILEETGLLSPDLPAVHIVAEARHLQTEEGTWLPDAARTFLSWSEGLPVVENLSTYAGIPAVLKMFHGTTRDFDAFELKESNLESDWGKGVYVTSDTEDCSINYAGLGPDLRNKIEHDLDRFWPSTPEEEALEAEGPDAIRAHLSKAYMHHEGYIMPVFVRTRCPAIMGGPAETFLELIEQEEEEGEEYTGKYQGRCCDIIESIKVVASRYNEGNYTGLMYDLWGEALDNGGLSLSRLHHLIRNNEIFNYYASDDGKLAAQEILRAALERCGFDAVIDYTVSQRHKNMKGMGPKTVHVIAFSPFQLKSSLGNVGTFDPSTSVLVARHAPTGLLEGAYDTQKNTVWLNASAFSTPEDVLFTYLHEVVGHRGLQATLHARYSAPQMTEVWKAARLHPWIDRLARVEYAQASSRPGSASITLDEATAEVLADVAAACVTGKYAPLKARYGLTVPLAWRPGLRGFIARWSARVYSKLFTPVTQEPCVSKTHTMNFSVHDTGETLVPTQAAFSPEHWLDLVAAASTHATLPAPLLPRSLRVRARASSLQSTSGLFSKTKRPLPQGNECHLGTRFQESRAPSLKK